jgi:hypothetical protein
MLRFTIRQLLLATVLIAVAIAALLNASGWWAAALSSSVLLILCAAVLLAVFRDGRRRAFWIGFSVFGWAYVALLTVGPTLSSNSDYPLGRNYLITEFIESSIHDVAAHGYPFILPNPDPFAAAPGADPFASPPAVPPPSSIPRRQIIAPLWRDPPDTHDFFVVSHALWTMGLAAGGGWFAVWASATRQRLRGQI